MPKFFERSEGMQTIQAEKEATATEKVNFALTTNVEEADGITRFDLKPEGAVLGAVIISLLKDRPTQIMLGSHYTQILAAIRHNQTGILRGEKIHIYNVGGVYNSSCGCFDCGTGSRETTLWRSEPTYQSYGAAGLLWYTYGIPFIAKQHKTLPERSVRQVMLQIDQEIICLADQGGLSEKWHFLQKLKLKQAQNETNRLSLFLECCELARYELVQAIERAVSEISGRDIIKAALEEAEDSKVLVLPSHFQNWRKTVLQLLDTKIPIIYTVLPERKTAGWRVETMPATKEPGSKPQKLFPEAWRGRQDTNLVEITGIKDAKYCASNGSYATARTSSAAIELANLAVCD